MKDFLIFTVYAPMASWGDIAVGEVRATWDRPSRSAILGMLSAALGVTREQQDQHDGLERGLGVAVRVDRPGGARGDYHTAQTVAASDIRRKRARTRATILRAGEPKTILSRRWYREDAHYTVAAWLRSSSPWSLEEIARALARPVFVPYAGRKAHPLALPMHPVVVQAATLADALRSRGVSPLVVWERSKPGIPMTSLEVAHDECDGFASGLVAVAKQSRRDGRPHRTRWLFSDRTVCIGLLKES